MHVPDIIEVKDLLEGLKTNGLIAEWELPYENILTRRSAAIFFLRFHPGADMDKAWKELGHFDHFSFRENTEKLLSELDYQITFSEEEKLKNRQPEEQAASAAEEPAN
ncbi:MAG: hypothetical protein H6562_06770 [Lewinellaceae bacterium]|nr:hypothetical protein [Lewinella sp.]MCB9278598.1 hypothetical protein [Lewinellaceae bacterium]